MTLACLKIHIKSQELFNDKITGSTHDEAEPFLKYKVVLVQLVCRYALKNYVLVQENNLRNVILTQRNEF